MTVPPQSTSGAPPPWNRPPAGTAWSVDAPPAGLPPQDQPGSAHLSTGGYPTPVYPTPVYPGGGPGQGYPPPYPAPGRPGRPPAQPGTNGFAIAALIFGIIGGLLLGFVFGFVALSQIKRSGQGGRGMAIAGLVLSGLWTLAVIGLVIVAVSTSADRDSSGQISSAGSVSVTALKAGDCVNNTQDSTSLLTLPAVPCSQAHEGEVFAVFDLPTGPYPGLAAVKAQVTDECTARLGVYSRSAVDDSAVGLFSVYPLEQNWKANDRQVVCVATVENGGRTTGSIKGR